MCLTGKTKAPKRAGSPSHISAALARTSLSPSPAMASSPAPPAPTTPAQAPLSATPQPQPQPTTTDPFLRASVSPPPATPSSARASASPGSASETLTASGSSNVDRKMSHIEMDITKLKVDAIVNAANESLLGGSGVDGAIHKAAGHELFNECRTLNGCQVGSAKITDGYRLKRKVIHAVGPMYYHYSHEEAEELLRGCYRRSLELAVENRCKTIAFSAISTGVYGYPISEATAAAISEVRNFLQGPSGRRIKQVIFCTFMSSAVTRDYKRFLQEYTIPPEEDTSGETWARNREAGWVMAGGRGPMTSSNRSKLQYGQKLGRRPG